MHVGTFEQISADHQRPHRSRPPSNLRIINAITDELLRELTIGTTKDDQPQK